VLGSARACRRAARFGGLAHDAALLAFAGGDQVADDDLPGANADTNPQRLRRLGPPDRINESQAGPYRLLGVVLMRLWVAEVHQHPIAHVLGDKAVEAGDRVSDATMIRADDLAQVLGVQACRKRRRADRSQNSTVSCRRSADDIGAAGRDDAACAGALDAPMVSAAPQSAQNFLPGGFSAPHAAQRTGRGVPQSPQNFFPSRLAAPQLGHSMPHPIDWMRAAYHSWLGPLRMKSVSAKRLGPLSHIGRHRQPPP
jgi:hypothetical protein